MKIVQAMLGISLLSLPLWSSALTLPTPGYLSVPDWQSCVGETKKGLASFICLPADKPEGCPDSSWSQLRSLDSLSGCP